MRCALAALALCGTGLAAVASAAGPSSVAGTEACLARLPDAIAGLPPATPPAQAVTFVYRARAAHLVPPVVGQVGAWRGRRGGYEGVTISFFKSPRAPAVSWDRPSQAWRRAVLGCVGAAGGGSPPARPVPPASFATFAGYWGGHTRGLRIDAAGRGAELTDDGCCTHVYTMQLRITSVHGTVTHATASYVVTSFRRYPEGPKLEAGQAGRLVLRNGIVTNSLTKVYFCSDPAWGATGACGA